LRWEWNDSRREVAGMAASNVAKETLRRQDLTSLCNSSNAWMEGRPAHGGDRRHRRFWWYVVGPISQAAPPTTMAPPKWNFQLHADRLDATNSDGGSARARARMVAAPLASLLGGAASTPTTTPNAHASELVRRVDAKANADRRVHLGKTLNSSKSAPWARLHDLHLEVREADAQWAGARSAPR